AVNIAAREAGCAAVITMASQAFVEARTVAGIVAAKHAFEQPGEIERLRKWHGAKAEWVLNAWTDVWLSPEFAGWSLAESIGQVVCPVLAIHGDQDEYGSIAFPEFIAGRAGGRSQMLILENCGHMPHKEKPAEVVEAVKVFLEGVKDISDLIVGHAHPEKTFL
ncbi:MAG: alpha/beta hydrolase, partial [Desulfobacterales bacterium]|nr:alpha/beta hydrolase [Desulfobacterales bacterium]